MSIEELRKLAEEHGCAGRWREAGEVYARILQAEPGDVEAVQMLAVAEHREGRSGEAEGRLRRAIAGRPGVADAGRFTREIEGALRGMWREWCGVGDPAAVMK